MGHMVHSQYQLPCITYPATQGVVSVKIYSPEDLAVESFHFVQ